MDRKRELAERASNGTRVRLLWRQGTRHLWIEVSDPEGVLSIPVHPERALDAFHHPYAYAGRAQHPTPGVVVRRSGPRGAA
jgi:hypothetical protein